MIMQCLYILYDLSSVGYSTAIRVGWLVNTVQPAVW